MDRSRRLALAVFAACVACNERDRTSGPDAHARSEVGLIAPDARPEGAETIHAAGEGRSFAAIASSFVIESPVSDGASVIYLFSKPVRCLDLSFAGWDRTVEDGTMVLDFTISGRSPGSYLAVTSPSLARGEAAVEFSRISPRGLTGELRASGGWVTLDAISRGGSASGSFAVTFGTDQWTGRFNAAFCPDGHEP